MIMYIVSLQMSRVPSSGDYVHTSGLAPDRRALFKNIGPAINKNLNKNILTILLTTVQQSMFLNNAEFHNVVSA